MRIGLLIVVFLTTVWFANPPGAAGEAQHEKCEQLQIDVLDNDPENDAPAERIHLRGRDARWQLLVTHYHLGQAHDVTTAARYHVESPQVVEVLPDGLLVPRGNGTTTVEVHWQGLRAAVQVEVTEMEVTLPVHFALQVEPIFTKHGCNGGGCHGKSAGQAGFKLSLLGFDALEDYRHLVVESRGRRLFPAAPEQSLLLLKATGEVPHGGGARFGRDSHEYRLLVRWIAAGMPFGADDAPVVTGIEVLPKTRQLDAESRQQLSVVAHYSDGSVEDITRMAQYESNNTDLAEVDARGVVQLRRLPGDVAVMARYQGHVAVARFTIPLGIDLADWDWPTHRSWIDELVFAKLRQLGLPPSRECDDGSFIRRVTLDLTGRLPTAEETEAFLQSRSPDKVEQLVDRLLQSVEHAEFFAQKWSAILRNRREDAGDQLGAFLFYEWLRDQIHANRPYDAMVRDLLTASGSLDINPPVVWWRQVDSTEERVEDAAQLFLGQRLQCAKCHHHPFEKWSQQDYFQFAAFFTTTTRLPGPTPDDPRYVTRVAGAISRHPKSGQALLPAGLEGGAMRLADDEDARVRLAAWMTSPQNRFFARSLVNRYWKHLFGVGFVEPEDDLRVTNPATNPALLEALADYFVDQGYDCRQLLRAICTSTVYRLDSVGNPHNLSDRTAYSRYYPKRLPAEVLLDAVDQVLGTHSEFAGLPIGSRAVSLPDTSFESYFLQVFGKPDSVTACECERSSDVNLAQTLHLMNSREIHLKLTDPHARPALMAAAGQPREQVEKLYLAAYSRHPNDEEWRAAWEYLKSKEFTATAYEDLVWAIINSKEFLFNH
ncbi:MAG: S-layer protein [Pirellulaceae bacterium]|nr:MAG: S-layer protein [Pirellulaceae bacterium]